MDDLLDEIDDVLEENAEELVKGYVQRGASSRATNACSYESSRARAGSGGSW